MDELDRLVELGAVSPDADGRFSEGDIRRVGIVHRLTAAGIPLDLQAEALRSGAFTLDFVDDPAYSLFSSYTDETFEDVSERTGAPLHLLTAIREATGSAAPAPNDHVREDELVVVRLLQFQLEHGYRPIMAERNLRVIGDSMRRIAEAEGDTWRSEIQEPLLAAGHTAREIGAASSAASAATSALDEQALVAMYRAQSANAWMANITEAAETLLAKAGLHHRPEHHPAMCFLDITGYTRLTQEHGDAAAADLATRLARLVERTSVSRGGRPVKWLGDGVMFYFPSCGPAVLAALEMVVGVADAGLPPAHVGLHSGPVIFQEGDYYGQTVNVASRIADYARPGEVLVSQQVMDASDGAGVVFREIGPVELKGVSGAMILHAASRAG